MLNLSQVKFRALMVTLTFLFSLQAAVQGGEQSPFEPDAQTMLLAHFDDSPWQADYAMGWDRFGGNGANLVEGYYGSHAVDLRGRQFSSDYAERDTGYTPYFTQWNFWPKGNVTYDQGTIEFWFRVAPSASERNLIGNDLMFFYWYQPLRPQVDEDFSTMGLPPLQAMRKAREMGKIEHIQPYIRLNQNRLSWLLVTRGGELLRDTVVMNEVEGFERVLNTENWHHFCMTWDSDQWVLYLDGAPVAVSDIQGQHGLALTSINQRPIAMNGIVMDDFRISSVVRYNGKFEPPWREGGRPEYAFTGVPGIQVQAGGDESEEEASTRQLVNTVEQIKKGEKVVWEWNGKQLTFDRRTGRLTGLGGADGAAEGLSLWRGLDREYLGDVSVGEWNLQGGALSFDQEYPNGLTVEHELKAGADGSLRWDVNFSYTGDQQIWLEALLGLPSPWESVEGYFDGSWEQDDFRFPRRRDEYVFTLPFAAVASGQHSLGVGVDPNTGLSSLISEFVPTNDGGVVRQGTRVVLDPGQTYHLPFILVGAEGEFGVRDALVAYHELFPDLYQLREDVPVYSYLPVCQHFPRFSIPDLARKFYIGTQWGHGPYHTKGDYMGTPRYWNNPELTHRADYQHAWSHSKLHGTIGNMRDEILDRSRTSFNNFYTLRRSHDVPNLTAGFIVDDLWPDFDDRDDPMVAGQYYLPKNLFVNEFETPLGDRFKEDMAKTMRFIGQYSPGFINDMCQISGYRFVDEIARSKPGRSFAADRGVYLVGAFGHVDRYRMINDFVIDGFRQSMWSDFGQVSYMLSAHSASNAFEAGEKYSGTSQMEMGLAVSRNLLGEKPIAGLVSYGADKIGELFEPEDFTPESLRDYYRYASRGSMLLAARVGYYMDPPFLHGNQWMAENQPLLVRSLVNGRKTVPGGRVADPLWLRRGGDAWDTFLVVGNETASEATEDVRLYHRYFSDTAPIFVPHFGGSLSHHIAKETTTLSEIRVPSRDMRGMLKAAEVKTDGDARVTANLEGDGLSLALNLSISLQETATLDLSTFGPVYRVDTIQLNDRIVGHDETINLEAGSHSVTVKYTAEAFKFDQETWGGVDLIVGDRPRFKIIGETRPGFARGSALQLLHFIEQYDEEDGQIGTMPMPEIITEESQIEDNFEGWVIDLRPDMLEGKGSVSIDKSARLIDFAGRTHGEIRRALTVFLRLLDRKYTAIGRVYPLRRDLSKEWEAIHRGQGFTVPWDDDTPFHELWLRHEASEEFYADFEDPDFLKKPILEKEYAGLYADGNVDFQDRYRIRFSPCIFEPTYDEDYVYGYSGEGIDETPELLNSHEYRQGDN